MRAERDRRKVYLEVTRTGAQEYRREHQGIIRIMQAIVEEIGDEDAGRLTTLLRTVTRVYQHNVLEEL